MHEGKGYDEEDYEGDDYDPVGDEPYEQGYYHPPPAPVGSPAIPNDRGGGTVQHRRSV